MIETKKPTQVGLAFLLPRFQSLQMESKMKRLLLACFLILTFLISCAPAPTPEPSATALPSVTPSPSVTVTREAIATPPPYLMVTNEKGLVVRDEQGQEVGFAKDQPLLAEIVRDQLHMNVRVQIAIGKFGIVSPADFGSVKLSEAALKKAGITWDEQLKQFVEVRPYTTRGVNYSTRWYYDATSERWLYNAPGVHIESWAGLGTEARLQKFTAWVDGVKITGFTKEQEDDIRRTLKDRGPVVDQNGTILDWVPGLDPILGGDPLHLFSVVKEIRATTDASKRYDTNFPAGIIYLEPTTGWGIGYGTAGGFLIGRNSQGWYTYGFINMFTNTATLTLAQTLGPGGNSCTLSGMSLHLHQADAVHSYIEASLAKIIKAPLSLQGANTSRDQAKQRAQQQMVCP